METKRVYLSLGTNLGDREANLEQAVERLSRLGVLAAQSRMMNTEPWGVKDQPDFLNMAVALDTTLDPLDLLIAVKTIEVEMGRIPSPRYGPRLIDIDILWYGGETVNLPGLTIPHPRMRERDFVLVPLADIAPELVAELRGSEG